LIHAAPAAAATAAAHPCGVHLHRAKLRTMPAQAEPKPPATGSRLRKSAAKRPDTMPPETAFDASDDFPFIHLEIRPSGQVQKETRSTKNTVNQPGFPALRHAPERAVTTRCKRLEYLGFFLTPR